MNVTFYINQSSTKIQIIQLHWSLLNNTLVDKHKMIIIMILNLNDGTPYEQITLAFPGGSKNQHSIMILTMDTI